jgi:hypothetical protein
MNSRFDDWKILSGISSEDKICLVDLTNNPLFENFKLTNNIIEINEVQLIDELVENKIKLDKIIISDFYTYKKIPNKIRTALNTLLNSNGSIILFKKNKPPYININFYSKKIFSKMAIVSQYSILPFYNDNPLFFLPTHKTNYIKFSLNILLSTMKTISPETKKKFGPIFTISIFLINLLSIFNLHIFFRVFSFGSMVVLKKS